MPIYVNEEELQKLRDRNEFSAPLNIVDIGRVFGESFWTLLTLCLTNITVRAEADKIQIIINESSK